MQPDVKSVCMSLCSETAGHEVHSHVAGMEHAARALSADHT